VCITICEFFSNQLFVCVKVNNLSFCILQLTCYYVQKLEQLNQYPDFNNYLIFVLTKLTTEGLYS